MKRQTKAQLEARIAQLEKQLAAFQTTVSPLYGWFAVELPQGCDYHEVATSRISECLEHYDADFAQWMVVDVEDLPVERLMVKFHADYDQGVWVEKVWAACPDESVGSWDRERNYITSERPVGLFRSSRGVTVPEDLVGLLVSFDDYENGCQAGQLVVKVDWEAEKLATAAGYVVDLFNVTEVIDPQSDEDLQRVAEQKAAQEPQDEADDQDEADQAAEPLLPEPTRGADFAADQADDLTAWVAHVSRQRLPGAKVDECPGLYVRIEVRGRATSVHFKAGRTGRLLVYLPNDTGASRCTYNGLQRALTQAAGRLA